MLFPVQGMFDDHTGGLSEEMVGSSEAPDDSDAELMLTANRSQPTSNIGPIYNYDCHFYVLMFLFRKIITCSFCIFISILGLLV